MKTSAEILQVFIVLLHPNYLNDLFAHSDWFSFHNRIKITNGNVFFCICKCKIYDEYNHIPFLLIPSLFILLFTAPIDIQSILNGAAKFCRHCDVVILNNLIKKKASELPFLSKEDLENGEDLYFCSPACYMQFALTHRSSASEDKVSIVVHKFYVVIKKLACGWE